MKAFVKLCALIMVFAMLCIPIAASSIPVKNIYTTDDVEIIFINDCPDIVANKIISEMGGSELSLGTPIMSPMSNALCTFGHNLSTGVIQRVYHNVYTGYLKCKQENWYYEVCSRAGCDYSVYTLDGYLAILCH